MLPEFSRAKESQEVVVSSDAPELTQFAADLHVHTRFSPCASEEMTPEAIILKARQRGIRILAICDHNTAEGIASVADAAIATNVTVLAGLEITTSEGFHVTTIFRARETAERVAAKIPPPVRATSQSCGWDLPAVERHVKEHGGLLIAAHVDRPRHSVLGDEEKLPPNILFDAMEVSPANWRVIGIREKFARFGLPLIASSDAHQIEDLGLSRTYVTCLDPTFDELARALRGESGRGVRFA
jgi:predicted metal-dependent phosphoesterase TrpH